MAKIESESRFIWKFILHVLMTPITLIMVIAGKKDVKELFNPFTALVQFIFQPKFSIAMIITNIIIFIWSGFWSEGFLRSLISYPSDLLSLRLHTLVTAGFLHANVTHLVGNMIGIFIFGRIVERKLGTGKTALVYFSALIVSGVFSSLIHLFILRNNIGGLGASGALMGLVATAMLIDPFYLVHDLLMPLPVMVIGWMTIYADLAGVLNPVEDGIGHLAHIGGFLSVALTMYLLSVDDKANLKKGLMINLVSLAVAGLVVFFILR